MREAQGRLARVAVGGDNGLVHKFTLKRHVAQLDYNNNETAREVRKHRVHDMQYCLEAEVLQSRRRMLRCLEIRS